MLCIVHHASLEGRGRSMHLVLNRRLNVGLVCTLVLEVCWQLSYIGLFELINLLSLLLEGLVTWVLKRTLLFGMLRRYLMSEMRWEIRIFVGLKRLLLKGYNLLLVRARVRTCLEGRASICLLILIERLICFHLSAIKFIILNYNFSTARSLNRETLN